MLVIIRNFFLNEWIGVFASFVKPSNVKLNWHLKNFCFQVFSFFWFVNLKQNWKNRKIFKSDCKTSVCVCCQTIYVKTTAPKQDKTKQKWCKTKYANYTAYIFTMVKCKINEWTSRYTRTTYIINITDRPIIVRKKKKKRIWSVFFILEAKKKNLKSNLHITTLKFHSF